MSQCCTRTLPPILKGSRTAGISCIRKAHRRWRMLEDLQQTLGAAAVSRHCFRHRARETETAPVRTLSLANVIAELPGRGAAGGNAPEGHPSRCSPGFHRHG